MASFNQNLYKVIELHYTKHSTVPSIEKLHELTGIEIERIEEAFDDEDFIQILKASYLYEYYTTAPGDLSLAQLSALHVFANQHDRRTIQQKLKALRITSQQFNRWMQDPTFSRTLNTRVQSSFKENGFRVFQSLLEQAAGGDFNSTKLYMEMNGYYTPHTRNHNTNVSLDVKSVDLLIEVILRVLGPLQNGQTLISQITTGFEQVLTTGSLQSPSMISSPQPQLVSRAEPHSPPIPVHSPLTSMGVHSRESPVEDLGSSGKKPSRAVSVEDFLAQVEDEYDDDLGI